MKRAILLVLALLLLTGCTAGPEVTNPVDTQPTVQGIYAPGHALETQTAGAVRVFPLAGCDGFSFMGKSVVAFDRKEDTTTLTAFVDENLKLQTDVTLDGAFLPDNKDLRMDQQRLAYYSRSENCIIFLDSGFQQTGKHRMPENMSGDPVISESMATVFYCTETEVRELSVETGINRLIRKQDCHSVSVKAALMSDSVLMCHVTDHDGSSYTEFISAKTGETLGEDNGLEALNIWENRYFLQRQDGLVTEYIFTADDGSQKSFHPETGSLVYSLLSMNSVATVETDNSGVTLSVYDLSEGRKQAQITLEGVEAAYNLVADPEQELVWFLGWNGEETVLCRWDPAKSSVTDDTVYTGPRYTANNPDTDGLAACREKADALEKQFGVEIYLVKEPLVSGDYSFIYEHQPSVIMAALEQLEKGMSLFPEGFLKTAAEVSDSKMLHIGLVRGLKSKTTGVPDGIAASQYWVNGDAWMALSVGNQVEQLFCHELAHVLDTFVYSKNVAYDEWVKLNPKDFQYDLSYFGYEEHGDSPYLTGEEQAFVDAYSMTYPKEDRARIFDCAVAEGNAHLFESEIMQNKLRQLCIGIRNAYDWKKDERAFLWEQYLETPLAYTKK